MDGEIDAAAMRGGAGRAGRRGRALLGAALAAALAAGQAARAEDDGHGTYRMHGTASVDAAAPFGQDVEARGDAVVRVGAGGTVTLRLASMGLACELAATRSPDGALALRAGQRCAFDLRDADARGRVDARLRSGRGRLRDRHLSLDLTFDLSGGIARRTGGGQLLGVELPSSWTPELPVSGGAAVQAEGDRDESRAAER